MSAKPTSPFSAEVLSAEQELEKATIALATIDDRKNRQKLEKNIEKMEEQINFLKEQQEEMRKTLTDEFSAVYDARSNAEKKVNALKSSEIRIFINTLTRDSLKQKIHKTLKKFGWVNRRVLSSALELTYLYQPSTVSTMVSQAYTDGVYRIAFKVDEEEKEITAK